MKHLIRIFPLIFIAFNLVSCEEKKEPFDSKIVEISYDFYNHMTFEREIGKPYDINLRDIIIIKCDSIGNCNINNKKTSISEIKSKIKGCLTNNVISENTPTIEKIQLKNAGNVFYPSRYIVLVDYHPEVSYSKYKEIRNAIFETYYDVRNEFSQLKYNKSIQQLINSNNLLDNERLKEIYYIYPIRYSEYNK